MSRKKVKPNYIDMRIEQLKEELSKPNTTHDKNWYNRLIQELDWVQQMKTKPTHNCHMQRNYGIKKGMME